MCSPECRNECMKLKHYYFRIVRAMGSVDSSVICASIGGPTGHVHWEIEKNYITTNNKFSPTVEVGGILWALCLIKDSNDDNILQAFLHQIEGDYEVQSVDTSYEINLINHEDDTKTIRKSNTQYKFVKISSWGFSNFAKWSDVIDEGEGFIKNDKVTLHCEFSLLKIRGFRKHLRFNFTDPNEVSCDVALVIEGEKIFVNKGYLSINSSVFQAMFYGDFSEKDKKEIELKDIKKEEFLEMLNVIYPPHKKITDQSVNFLAKLGDRYEIDILSKAVEQFLIDSESVPISAKLLYADQYRLYNLQDHCIDQMTKPKDVKDLKNSIHFKYLSEETIDVLFEKLTKLID